MDLTRNKITTALNKLNLSENAYVTLKYKAGTQVFHYTGDYLDDAFNETQCPVRCCSSRRLGRYSQTQFTD